MINRKLMLGAFLLVACGSSAIAQELLPSTVLMRDMANSLYRDLNSMVKGEAPFDAKKAEELDPKSVGWR